MTFSFVVARLERNACSSGTIHEYLYCSYNLTSEGHSRFACDVNMSTVDIFPGSSYPIIAKVFLPSPDVHTSLVINM